MSKIFFYSISQTLSFTFELQYVLQRKCNGTINMFSHRIKVSNVEILTKIRGEKSVGNLYNKRLIETLLSCCKLLEIEIWGKLCVNCGEIHSSDRNCSKTTKCDNCFRSHTTSFNGCKIRCDFILEIQLPQEYESN